MSSESKTISIDNGESTNLNNLEAENLFLRDQVKRLNEELSSFQKQSNVKLPTRNGIELPDYALNSEQFSPLLLAYDCRIEELSSFVERQGSVLDTLTERSNDLLAENENLRSRIIPTISKQKSFDMRNKGNVMSNLLNNEQFDPAIKQLLSDKHLLEEQAELLVKELKDSNKAVVRRDKTISSLSNEVKEKLQTIQKLNSDIKHCRQQNRDVKKELGRRIESLADERNQNKVLEENIHNLQNRQDEMSSKVEGAGLDKQYLEAENYTLSEKMSQSAILIQELQTQLSNGVHQYSVLNEKNLELNKELAKAQKDLEKSTQSNAELMLRYNYSNEKLNELEQLKKDQSLKLKDLEVNLAKNEAKCTILQDEVNRIVLGRQKSKNGEVDDVLVQESSELLKQRDELIQSLKKKNTELEMEVEKGRRETDISRSSKQVMERNLHNERLKTRNEIEKLHNETKDSNTRLKIEQTQLVESKSRSTALQREVMSLQASLNTRDTELQRAREEDRRRSQEYSKSKALLQAKVEDLQSKLLQETSKLNDENDSLSLKLDEARNRNDSDSSATICKVDQLEESLKESAQSNQKLRIHLKKLTKESTEKERKMKSQFQEKILKVKDEMNEQMDKNNELLSNLRRLSNQKFKLDVLLKQSSSEIYTKERKLLEAEGRVSLLSKQLHDNLSDQSEKVSQIQKLKLELRQLKINKIDE